MGGYLPAVITAAVGLVGLVVLLLGLRGPVRRLTRARAQLDADLESGMAPLTAELNTVRGRSVEPPR
ncbi:hypothetical protein [Pseudonocardia acidicola]|uniref:Uncharacterized protein n=1 Tax=Pseudonocardia acidicola TaxID=2724939 RepID=A0ABX1SCN5_9PSEU|nr:hypothetical protein [Pseudonocardia acidicola]NMH99336.1 hypothetical protein [Pseudonocardia acidicola]